MSNEQYHAVVEALETTSNKQLIILRLCAFASLRLYAFAVNIKEQLTMSN